MSHSFRRSRGDRSSDFEPCETSLNGEAAQRLLAALGDQVFLLRRETRSGLYSVNSGWPFFTSWPT